MASKNAETLKKAHQAFKARQFDLAAKLVAAHTKVTDHGRGQTLHSRGEFHGWLEDFFRMASNLKIAHARYIDGGGWVTAQFHIVGTQDGPLGPFAPGNRNFSLDVCEVWCFNSDGEAIEGHNYSDGLGLAVQ